MRNKGKDNRGITLIALVVTIVVLIILAVISINAVLGDDGIIRRSEQAREHQANAEVADNDALEDLDEQVANAIGEVKVEDKKTEEELREILGKEQGDSAIDEDGNIVDLSLWNIEPIDETTCRIAGFYDESGYTTIGDKSYNAYKGKIIGGKIEGNIPAFAKIQNNIYKITEIDTAFQWLSRMTVCPKIPYTVTRIGGDAFFRCSGLTSVTIDSSTIAALITTQYGTGYLVAYATTIYIKDTIPESSIGSYITNTDNFTKVESDKEGYIKYTKN